MSCEKVGQPLISHLAFVEAGLRRILDASHILYPISAHRMTIQYDWLQLLLLVGTVAVGDFLLHHTAVLLALQC